jgi:hypothetical protein
MTFYTHPAKKGCILPEFRLALIPTRWVIYAHTDGYTLNGGTGLLANS